MSVSTATVTGGSLKLTLKPALVTGVVGTDLVNLSLLFPDATFITHQSGSFTPSNDYQVVKTFAAGENPTWLMLIVDRLANINLNTAASQALLSYLPVNRVLYYTSVKSLSPLGQMLMRGETVLPNPMAQGVACNYVLYWGDGTVDQS